MTRSSAACAVCRADLLLPSSSQLCVFVFDEHRGMDGQYGLWMDIRIVDAYYAVALLNANAVTPPCIVEIVVVTLLLLLVRWMEYILLHVNTLNYTKTTRGLSIAACKRENTETRNTMITFPFSTTTHYY